MANPRFSTSPRNTRGVDGYVGDSECTSTSLDELTLDARGGSIGGQTERLMS